jgi:hypothetical protein
MTNSLLAAELYDPATGLWTLTSALGGEPSAHTATLLPNGMVLVTGGATQISDSVTTASVYNPVTETWTTTGPMAFDRQQHTATLLPNGQVLVAGGFFGYWLKPLASAEVYDPGTGRWTATPSLKSARGAHTATLLTNGLVLVAGVGGDPFLSSTELFDLGPMTVPATPPTVTNVRKLPDGSFQFSFTNNPGASFSVLVSTNLSLLLSNWTIMGGITEISPGQFQFTDSQATNYPGRFYRVRSL